MMELTSPSKDLAERVLTEVGFEDRLTGYRLRERTGATTIRLYSFEEVVGLLNDLHPRLDFDRLERWIRETMGDPELAEKIEDVIQEDMSDRVRTLRIKDLMALRLYQCLQCALA
jgi:hypothetical protein